MRRPIAIVPFLLAAALILGGLLWRAGDRVAGVGRTLESGGASVGGPFHLIDQNGAARSPADFRGRFMLVYFGYSYCPDVCPTTLAEIAAALGKLGPKARRFVPIFITIDPERDTPAVLKTYMKDFGPRFLGLTGSAKSVAEAARAYHVYIRKRPLAGGGYSMDHSGVIYLMGPDGGFVTYYEEQIGPDKLAEDLGNRV
jgi:protein SCO1/2